MAVCIRPLRLSPEEADPARCLAIYNTYILHSTATFEEEPLTLAAFTARLRRITAQYPFLVAEEDGLVLGYAYLDQYNDRSAYRYTADVSIYLDEAVTAKGIGGQLLAALEQAAAAQGLRTLVSIITEENTGSLHFHEKHGFVRKGQLDRVGLKFGRWLGVWFLQKELPQAPFSGKN